MIPSLGRDWTKLSHKDENSKMSIFLPGGPGCLCRLCVGKGEDNWSWDVFTFDKHFSSCLAFQYQGLHHFSDHNDSLQIYFLQARRGENVPGALASWCGEFHDLNWFWAGIFINIPGLRFRPHKSFFMEVVVASVIRESKLNVQIFCVPSEHTGAGVVS